MSQKQPEVVTQASVVVVVVDALVVVDVEETVLLVTLVDVAEDVVVEVRMVVVVVVLGATVTLVGVLSFTLSLFPRVSVRATDRTDSGCPKVVILPLNFGNLDPIDLNA